MIEEWRDIPDWDGYQASSLGRIRSATRVRKLFRCPTTGYMKVGLASPKLSKGRRTVSVHTLVCTAFHGAKPWKHDAAHWNGDRSDNRPGNLRWCTRKDNLADRVRHGTLNIGDRNGMSNYRKQLRAALAA